MLSPTHLYRALLCTESPSSHETQESAVELQWLDELLGVKTGEGEGRKARLVSIIFLNLSQNGACVISYLYPGHRNATARHMANNYGLKLKEPGCHGFRVELSTGFKQYIQIIAAPAIPFTAIITTSVHFGVDKLGEIDDEVLVLASSNREVENALEIDRFYEHLGGCVINSPCARRKG